MRELLNNPSNIRDYSGGTRKFKILATKINNDYCFALVKF